MNLDRETLQKLHHYATSLTGDKNSAYDLLHNAIETCLNKPPLENAKLTAYIRTIMRNKYIDDYRREQTHPTDNIDDHILIDMNTSSLENTVIAEHDMQNIWFKLEGLEREILYYWAIEGHSMQEISDLLNIPRGTLLSRIHRLRHKIIGNMHNDSIERGYIK